MTWETYISHMALLSKNYSKNIFNPKDADMVNLWFKMLEHYEDRVFISAVKKIMVNEVFAPNLATISKYCTEIAAPIEVDDTEGWGLVVKAINQYGYMRAEEAIKSLPNTVRQAVERVGGFEMVCSCEEPDVIRGQFNRAMAAINQSERTRRREKDGLFEALALSNTVEEPMKIESQEWKRSSKESVDAGIEGIHEILNNLGIRR